MACGPWPTSLSSGGEGKKPFGLLQIDSRVPREFSARDLTFLRSYANLIAAAVDRLRTMAELRDEGVRLRHVRDSLELRVLERTRDLAYIAFHDDLTGLSNRGFFMDRLKTAVNRTKLDAEFRCAVLFLDLDHFKLVNDSLGHQVGDLLLIEVADRLKSCTRAQDTLARMGGDEFALLVEGYESLVTVITIAKRIILSLKLPVRLGKHEISRPAA